MTSGISSASPPPAFPNAGAQQIAALNKLVAQYKIDLTRKINAQTLSSLSRQISTMANALGQHVVMPKASGGSLPSVNAAAVAPAATPPAAAGPSPGRLNVTA